MIHLATRWIGGIALAAVLACNTAPIEGGPLPVELSARPEALLAQLQSDAPAGLPQFWIFERSGAAILYEEGYSLGAFQGHLAKAVAAAQPLAGEPPFAERVQGWERPAPGGALDAAQLQGDTDFVFVEYWASWCSPCKMQMRAVQEYLMDHPEQRIAWLKVEFDTRAFKKQREQAAAAQP